jgi:hypothetical protein
MCFTLLENSVYVLSRYSQLFVTTTRQAVYYKRNNEALSCNHCCRGKAKVLRILCACSLIYSAHKAHRPIILVSVASPTLPYFSTLSHNRHDSQEKKP